MKNKHFAKFILTASTILTAAFIGNAQTCPPLTAGCLDYTFGGGGSGTNLTYVPNYVDYLYQENATIQSDGKILGLFDMPNSAGKDVVIRYNANGTLDTGFASGGFLYVNWNITNYAALPVLLTSLPFRRSAARKNSRRRSQSCSTNLQIGLQIDRYNSDGSIDTTFGTNGTVKYSYTVARPSPCKRTEKF